MTVNLDKYEVTDIKEILFEDLDTFETVEYNGHRLDLKGMTVADRRYIAHILCEAYEKGAWRTADCINRDADRQVQQAQTRAIKRLMKGKA